MACDQKPLVSVVMTAYNEELFISQAINSILEQAWRHFELIVVDDGSTDGTATLAAQLAAQDKRVRVVNSNHQGRAGALNSGLSACSGKYIAIFDADDVAYSRRLEAQVCFLEEHLDIGLVGAWCEFVDARSGTRWSLTPPVADREIRRKAIRGNPIPHTTLMFRREVVDVIGAYRKSSFIDYDFEVRALKQFRAAILPEILVTVNVHEGSVMTSLRLPQFWKRAFRSRINAVLLLSNPAALPWNAFVATGASIMHTWRWSKHRPA